MKLCEVATCTGCMACVNICPINAIQTQPDKEGFLRPLIDENKCMQCGKCRSVCPQLTVRTRPDDEKKVYACWQKDRRLRKASTSGGAFSALAQWVLLHNGVIFGAGFDEKLTVVHKKVENIKDLEQLRGSKYVQSNTLLTFREVKRSLIAGKAVLYSGTACQIDGLYAFLGDRYKGQLYTIDLVCHGVPSPKIYRDYLEYQQNLHGAKVKKIFFRNKEPGWYVFGMKLVFDNNKTYKASTYEDPFIRGFLRELFLRPSCHQCSYAGIHRVADITLADFWGYMDTCRADRDNDKGISMVMLNTENGYHIFSQIREMLHIWERPLEQAVNGNPALKKCFPPSKKREAFWRDYTTIQFSELIEKYMYPEPRESQYYPNLKERHKQQDMYMLKILPNRITMKLLGEKGYQKLKHIMRMGSKNANN